MLILIETEILKVLQRKKPYSIPKKVGKVFPPFSFVKRFWETGLRSGIVGTIIGAIPGTGANIATAAAVCHMVILLQYKKISQGKPDKNRTMKSNLISYKPTD